MNPTAPPVRAAPPRRRDAAAFEQNHEGKLDGASCADAASIVAKFAGFYRNQTLPVLLDKLASQFTRVVALPIMRGAGAGAGGAGAGSSDGSDAAMAVAAGAPALPLELLQHVARGLREVRGRVGGDGWDVNLIGRGRQCCRGRGRAGQERGRGGGRWVGDGPAAA